MFHAENTEGKLSLGDDFTMSDIISQKLSWLSCSSL